MAYVRIAELSRRSGVTIPTIKYYLREGLLPAGTVTGRNQASYEQWHLQRLRLIRALREAGGLGVAAIREVVRVLEEPDHSYHELMGRAHYAVIGPARDGPTDPEWAAARADAQAWVRELGWRVEPGSPALDQLADVVVALRRLDYPDLRDWMMEYAEAVLPIAERDVTAAAANPDPATAMTTVVIGTVLGGAALSALRLLAHQHVSAGLRT